MLAANINSLAIFTEQPNFLDKGQLAPWFGTCNLQKTFELFAFQMLKIWTEFGPGLIMLKFAQKHCVWGKNIIGGQHHFLGINLKN